VYNVTLVF